jgi:predicted membrane-bound mannosyltransferase
MMVFYSRYYIQEMMLVFLTYLFMAAVWRYTRGAPAIWALLAGATLGLMHATKETWVLSVGAMSVAALLTYLWSHWIDKRPVEWRAHWRPHLKARGVALGAVLAIIFFSSLGTNPRGPIDSIRAYTTYLNRGGGEGEGGSSGGSDSDHVHPAGFHSGRLIWTKYDFRRNEILFWDMANKPELFKKPSAGPSWSEAFILVMAYCGFVAALAKRGLGRAHLTFLRFLAFYTVVLALIYELIPYKTPWLALGFWHTAILLAGFGAAAVVRSLRPMPLKIIAVILMLLGTAQLAKQSLAANTVPPQTTPAKTKTAPSPLKKWMDANGRFGADERNPWVYAHTSVDIFNLIERVEGLAKATPEGDKMRIKVIAADPWPLPWYLRSFKQVAYYSEIPPDLLAGDPQVIITSREYQEQIKPKMPNYIEEIFGQRPRVYLVTNTKPQLWEKFLETRRLRAVTPQP